MRLDLDTEVRFPEGERAGFLRKIILDDQNAVTEVVIESTGFISRKVAVPISLLSEGPGGVTYINCTPEEFDNLKEYIEDQVPAVTSEWEYTEPASAFGEAFPVTTYEPLVPVTEVANLPEGWTSLSQGTEIWCMDQPWGTVDQVLVDDNGQPSAIIGLPEDIEQRKRLIPIQLVQQYDGGRVILSGTMEDLEANSEEITEGIGEPEST